MNKKISKTLILGVIIFIVACIVRLLYLNSAFWYDEACSWAIAKLNFPYDIVNYLWNTDLQHTPLYFFVLHFWMKLFGTSEIAIQSLSVIFGILTVPLSFIVSKKLTTIKTSIIIASIISVCPILVYFSTEARMYSLVTFLVLLSLNYLVDFEQKNDAKSLIKLVITNILIPYTFVGGILYNLSLAISYFIYLSKNKKENIIKYLYGFLTEIILLIPYFILTIHYASIRKLFVIQHEGNLIFFNIIDIIRNFFGTNIIQNIYWTSETPYNLTLAFTIFVIVPCVYFLYGIFQGFKISENKFIKTLYLIFTLNFLLFVIITYFQVSVLTGRYMLYLLPPLFILAIIGLSNKLTQKHLTIFSIIFIICSLWFNITNLKFAKQMKLHSLKDIAIEAKELALNADDIIIMPIGSDAPYYFQTSDTPRVLNFDFHKDIRNPFNPKFYDENQMYFMSKNAKYGLIYDSIFSNKGFSKNHFKYFVQNVNMTVPSKRYAVIALYGEDAKALVSLDVLRSSIKSVKDIKENMLTFLLSKYLIDITSYLNYDFKFIKSYKKYNYTYLIFQKL
jgi:uncharacterized membrane protein